MKQYLIKRVLLAAGILFAISIITFFVLNIIPGDPVALMLGDNANPQTIETVRHNLGMDKPLALQYLDWITGFLTGNMGESYFQHKAVSDMIVNAFGYTARLAAVSYIVALVLGLTIGIIAALNRGNAIDHTLMTVAVAGISAPSFWVAIVLQIFIGLRFKAIPISGLNKPAAYLLPCLSLGTRYAASIARITRTSMLEVMNQDFIRTARAKGLSRLRTVMVRADSHYHRHRHGPDDALCGQYAHRVRLQHPRHGRAAGGQHHQARHSRGAGRRDGGGAAVRGHLSGGRPALCGGRPEHPSGR